MLFNDYQPVTSLKGWFISYSTLPALAKHKLHLLNEKMLSNPLQPRMSKNLERTKDVLYWTFSALKINSAQSIHDMLLFYKVDSLPLNSWQPIHYSGGETCHIQQLQVLIGSINKVLKQWEEIEMISNITSFLSYSPWVSHLIRFCNFLAYLCLLLFLDVIWVCYNIEELKEIEKRVVSLLR